MTTPTKNSSRCTLGTWGVKIAIAPFLLLFRIVEFFYFLGVSLRNAMFDIGLYKSRRLPRTVISVGNISMGGTGKTPVIRWLADRLRDDGHHLCVLSRGYKARPGELGDELAMLGQMLNQPGKEPVELRADPRRFAAGEEAITNNPSIDLFLLDDGYQHRMLARDFDIVLFGAAYMQRRKMVSGPMREPLGGLRRAQAIVITRADQVADGELAKLEELIRRHNPHAPIYRAVHALKGFRSVRANAAEAPDISLRSLADQKWMPFCGIADEFAFVWPLVQLAGQPVDRFPFADHHDYTEADLIRIRERADERGATVLVTTEKDWVKLARFPLALDEKLPIWRAEMEIEFLGDGEAKLLDAVRACLRSARTAG